MAKTAILVDGAFYRRVSTKLWGKKKPGDRADELYEYVMKHIDNKREARLELGRRELYRIFYYDCPPVGRATVWHPLLKKNVHYKPADEAYKWTEKFHLELSKKRKVACRFGEVITDNASFNLKPWVTKDLMAGNIGVDDLKESDFSVSFKQSGVDMRIGLDIASLAYEGIVDQIVLVSADMDFLPAAKVARRHGIDFILDPMGQHFRQDLHYHVDGVETFV